MDEEIEVFYAEEGETGSRVGSVTQERLDAIVLYDCIPASQRKGECPRSIVELSARVGVSTGRIRQLRTTKRYRDAFDHLIRGVARQMLPELLWSQYQYAIERHSTKAAQFVVEQSKEPELKSLPGGNNTYIYNQHQTVNVNADKLIEEDERILGEVKDLAKRGDLLRRLREPRPTRDTPPSAGGDGGGEASPPATG